MPLITLREPSDPTGLNDARLELLYKLTVLGQCTLSEEEHPFAVVESFVKNLGIPFLAYGDTRTNKCESECPEEDDLVRSEYIIAYVYALGMYYCFFRWNHQVETRTVEVRESDNIPVHIQEHMEEMKRAEVC